MFKNNKHVLCEKPLPREIECFEMTKIINVSC